MLYLFFCANSIFFASGSQFFNKNWTKIFAGATVTAG